MFDESLVLLVRSDNSSIYTDLNGVKLEVELQLETLEVAGTNVAINTNGACNEVEFVKPTVVVTTDIDKIHIRSLDRYGCDNGFALSMIKEIVLRNICVAIKNACEVGVFMRSSIMAKFKRDLNLEDICGS